MQLFLACWQIPLNLHGKAETTDNLNMTDSEFELLDELYFVKSFEEIRSTLRWEDGKICETLGLLLEKGWIRCYKSPTDEILDGKIDLAGNCHNYFYLASKEGLVAHNSTEQL